MARPRKDGGSRVKSFSLTEEQIDSISQNTFFNNFKSDSDFVGFLIDNYETQSNPAQELRRLNGQKKLLLERLDEINAKEIIALKKIENQKIKQEIIKEKRFEAIEMLKRKILENEPISEIERLAKNRALRLGCDPYELIFIAGKEIKSSNLNNI